MVKNRQYYKFCLYGFLKNLRFFDAFFILFLVDKGLSYTEIGILYASRAIFINIFEIPSGIIADTYGRKNSLIGSFVAYILSFYLFFVSTGFWFFMGAFVLYGIGDSFRSGTHKGMIMDYLKLKNWENQKISYYGHTRSWSQKGSAISSLVAGLIVFSSGTYQNIFIYSIVPYIINLLLILSYPKALNRSGKQRKGVGFVDTIKFFVRVIKLPKVLRLINTSAVHTAYLQAVKDYIQPLIVNLSVALPVLLTVDSEKKNGLVVGVVYFFIFLATSRASKLAPGFVLKRKEKITYTTLLFGFGFGIVSGIFYLGNIWGLSLVAFVGIYIVENIRKPILTGFISDNVPNEILASVISAQSLLRTVLTAVFAFGFGIIADLFGIGISLLVLPTVLIIFSLFLNFYSTKRVLS